MAVTTTKTNKPLNPRGNDQSPKGYNRAELYTGKALDFDGVNDYVGVLGATDIWTGDFTVSWYANLDTTANQFIFSSGNYTGYTQAGINFWYSGSAGSKRMSVHFPKTSGTGHIGYNLTLNEEYLYWHRIDFVYVDSTRVLSLYQNGIFVDSATIDSSVDAAYMPNGWTFGKGFSGFFTNGKLATLKTYNVALTAAQVADLYNNPEKIVPTGVADSALKLWLPMMEGAGTTAYDGSGNGNHGTISGATWTHGIGAPVAQTAVIDWNKGVNILGYSIWDNSYWTASGGVVTDGIEAPDGTNTAFKFERDDASSGTIYKVEPFGLSGTNYRYVYAKLPSGSASASAQLLTHNTNTNNTFTITDEWQRFELNSSPLIPLNFYIVDFRGGVGVDEIHLWAPQAAAGTDESVFVPTIGTAQSNEILLPQGLTTGRDITGVNLFENVRKQGALNLDGNSFAAIHDNTSLDITDAITLECWYYYEATTQAEQLIGKRASSGNWLRLYWPSTGRVRLERNGGAALDKTGLASGNWYHIAATIDESDNAALYINGVEENTATNYSPWGWDIDVPVSIGAWIYNTSYVASSLSYAPNPIAQPRIYNRALTAEEVERNYTAGKYIYTND